jgi:hypothetical protein
MSEIDEIREESKNACVALRQRGMEGMAHWIEATLFAHIDKLEADLKTAIYEVDCLSIEKGGYAEALEAEHQRLREALAEIMVNYPPGSMAHLVAKRGLGQTEKDPYATLAQETEE